jgi:hypothetical protein
MLERNLWHDDDKRPTIRMRADCRRQPDLCLIQTIRSSFARAVQEKDDRPPLVVIPVFRKIDLVLMGRAMQAERTVEEARVLMTGKRGRGKSSETQEEKETA